MGFPAICLGGNVFGWTADEGESFVVLDGARDAGINFLDTADVYSDWANGGVGGQSETIIGRWMQSRGARDETVLATKVGLGPGVTGLRPATVRQAVDESLQRLQTDTIDLYYAHRDDGGDLAETFGAFDELVQAGKIKLVGVSNFGADRLREVFEVCDRDGLSRPVALQPQYSLMERGFEDDGLEVAVAEGLAVMPYYALASGFLTGKYRPGEPGNGSPRADTANAYLAEPRAKGVLAALDAAAVAHDVPVTSVALAWLRSRPTVAAPVASARTAEQVAPIAQSLGLELSSDELAELDAASQAA